MGFAYKSASVFERERAGWRNSQKIYTAMEEEKKKRRQLKTPAQVTALEQFHNYHRYPSKEMKSRFAEQIGLTEKQVSSWFCHRRSKDKRPSRAPDQESCGSVNQAHREFAEDDEENVGLAEENESLALELETEKIKLEAEKIKLQLEKGKQMLKLLDIIGELEKRDESTMTADERDRHQSRIDRYIDMM